MRVKGTLAFHSSIAALLPFVAMDFFFSLYVFWRTSGSFFLIFSSVAPHRDQPAAEFHPQVATHLEIGSQLWAGETPDLNPGQQSGALPLSHHASHAMAF